MNSRSALRKNYIELCVWCNVQYLRQQWKKIQITSDITHSPYTPIYPTAYCCYACEQIILIHHTPLSTHQPIAVTPCQQIILIHHTPLTTHQPVAVTPCEQITLIHHTPLPTHQPIAVTLTSRSKWKNVWPFQHGNNPRLPLVFQEVNASLPYKRIITFWPLNPRWLWSYRPYLGRTLHSVEPHIKSLTAGSNVPTEVPGMSVTRTCVKKRGFISALYSTWRCFWQRMVSQPVKGAVVPRSTSRGPCKVTALYPPSWLPLTLS